MEKKVLNFIYS
uniref:Uncharacterized protein n=1 Tax=Anguilla anguilla TaxID=7936 RepID=A0A0E9PVS4_ANGAN